MTATTTTRCTAIAAAKAHGFIGRSASRALERTAASIPAALEPTWIITSASAMGRMRTAEFLDTNTRPITTDEPRTVHTLGLRSIAQKHQTDAVSVSVINKSDVMRLPCANMLGQKA